MGYPEDKATETWEKDGIGYSIVQHSSYGHYCGYCRFPERPLIEEGYFGIATYVPVHGGITYAKQDVDGSMVYGFDCAHAEDDEKPETRDVEWLKAECERMAEAIKIAVRYESLYLKATNSEDRAFLIDEYCGELDGDYDFSLNFEAMMNLLCGRL